MNTPANPKFSISATYLGPVLHLNGELTKNAQNLIFARNGTGKSFLSRAFRYLDLHGQNLSLGDAPRNLVSDESPDGKGTFFFGRGTDLMGALTLEKIGDKATPRINETIFHVFSEDFVHEELREQEYSPNGQIENQISVDANNIQLREAQEALNKAERAVQSAFNALRGYFDKEKVVQLNDKAGVRKQLKEYVFLNLEDLLLEFSEKPKPPTKSFSEILKDFDGLKAIPAEPLYPEIIDTIELDDIDLSSLVASLRKVTSPSSISEIIKQKIDLHREFYRTGIDIIDQDHPATCPFCEQGITGADPKAIIDAYIGYFSDEEEKHKSELRRFYALLNSKEKLLQEAEVKLTRQKLRHDTLKVYLPSTREKSLADCENAIKAAIAVTLLLKHSIEGKAKSLGVSAFLSHDNLSEKIGLVNQLILDNNMSVKELSRAISKSDEERKELQRQACHVFKVEFAISRWQDIDVLRLLKKDEASKAVSLAALERSSPSTNARERVADTFELLLKDFFGEKYVFDKGTFVLKRGTHEMMRGPHRTLSDGEKTAIAFCYFVACIHRKVTANSDYRRLFLVFDDPVTSMSYDFVFAIAQTLKNLNISDHGAVSINPGLIDGNKCWKPELLILTHSSYFFNISATNKVVEENATFALHSDKGIHRISRLNKYIAPFQEQLKDIYEVSNGRDPDHSTANAIRSVLEAVGRFCRPDKSSSLTVFVQHLAAEDGIIARSVLINSFCHGTYYDEVPSPDDLRLACSETVKVVEKYAAGQLEVVKGIATQK
jgi:hypothetical protein